MSRGAEACTAGANATASQEALIEPTTRATTVPRVKARAPWLPMWQSMDSHHLEVDPLFTQEQVYENRRKDHLHAMAHAGRLAVARF